MPQEPTAAAVKERYQAAGDLGLDLDMTRGKPCAEQLDLSRDLLAAPEAEGFLSRAGADGRNYGILEGLPEARELFGGLLGIPPAQILLGDNASLSLMYDVLSEAVRQGVPGSPRPWGEESRPKILCPAPGYDRHFTVCEFLGLEMIPIEIDDIGPDTAAIARLVASDPTVKGIFCVPRYSNPTGATYSDEVVTQLAAMETAAPDFRILWDDAYAFHHLYPDPPPLRSILDECARAGHPDRAFVFASTSKVTFPGAGISMVASSVSGFDWLSEFRSKKTIGPDKLNQLRHVRFLRDGVGLEAHMARHAEIIRPKFELVDQVLREELGNRGVASWSQPRGGYFISLDTAQGCAKEAVAKAAAAGVKLTPAGATFPYGKDPLDRNIRIAPTFPTLPQLRQATEVLALSILLVSFEKGVL